MGSSEDILLFCYFGFKMTEDHIYIPLEMNLQRLKTNMEIERKREEYVRGYRIKREIGF